MKIGIWIGSELLEEIGGASTYTSRFVRLVDSYTFSKDIEICFLSLVSINGLNKSVIPVSQIPALFYKITGKCSRFQQLLMSIDRFLIKKKGMRNVLKNTDVKIVYYIAQSVCLDPSFPFLSTNWDIGHRSTHSFPEFIDNCSFEFRDLFYKTVLPKALMILCDSEAGKKELVTYANIGEHKIRVLPIFAGGVCSINVHASRIDDFLQSIGVEKYKFFYYPAQFWAHKNHYGLLCAFKEFVSQKGMDYKLVLSGSDRGNLLYIKDVATKLGLIDNVIFLGFITEEEVYSLYKSAMCLVMASHFGPTNMPPIEAMELGCPVACSDLAGHKEILGKSAVYFDSYDSHSIFKAMDEVALHRDYYANQITKQSSVTKYNVKNTLKALDDILLEAITIRSNWE